MGKSPGLKLQASVVQDNVPVEVAPGLFVGSIHAAFNVDALKDKKISHILNLAGAYATFPDDFTYLSVSIRDKEYANLLSCLPVAMLFLDAGIRAGGVLVHCAGGRSRSPAVAISYLMAKDKLSYESAIDHMKALRPVVSLNAGFEAQLRFLERANGNVFDAHQLHLQSKLEGLLQRRLDGSLELTKRRQNRHQQQHKHALIPRTPPHPPMGIRSQHLERQVSCCDDRGMLDGTLPSGFCLSVPVASKRKKKVTQFIPALRSMGSMFGCRTCGEHLFCASAIVQHSATSNLNPAPSADSLPSPTSRSRSHEDGSFGFEEPVARESDDTLAASSPGGAEIGPKGTAAECTVPQPSPPPPPPASETADPDAKKTRKPLLAKLRLRPQSPSVINSPTGSDKSTPRSNCSSGSGGSGAVPVELQQVHPSALAGKPEQCALSREGVPEITARAGGGGVLKSLKKEKTGAHHDVRVEKDEDAAKSAGGAHGSTSKGGGPDKLWRTLTAFAATKRIFKDSKDRKQHSGDASPVDEKKRVKTSGDGGCDADAKRHSPETSFLRENAAAWERGLRTIEKVSGDVDGERAVLSEVAALIAADAKVLSMLSCEEWFIEPQDWFLDGLIESPSGVIRCPNGGCGAVVGQWRWDGLSCSCGGRVCPGTQMKRSAIQPLGNIVTQLWGGSVPGGQSDALRHCLK